MIQVNIWSNNTHPPLTLVLSSYEPANYVVTVPDEVTIAHVFQVSLLNFFASFFNVLLSETAFSEGSYLSCVQ